MHTRGTGSSSGTLAARAARGRVITRGVFSLGMGSSADSYINNYQLTIGKVSVEVRGPAPRVIWL